MTKSEYGHLVDFLSKKFAHIDERFEHIDERFAHIDERFDRIDLRFEEQARHTGVLMENLEHRIQIVAEGVTANGERIDRLERLLRLS
jgi:hypothetical protein